MNLKHGTQKHSNYGQEIFLGNVLRSVKNILRTTALGFTAGTTVGVIAAIRDINFDRLAEDVAKIFGQIPASLSGKTETLELALDYHKIGSQFLLYGAPTAALSFALAQYFFKKIGDSANVEFIKRGRTLLQPKELNGLIEKWMIGWIEQYAKQNPDQKWDFHRSFDLGESFGNERKKILFDRYFTLGEKGTELFLPEEMQYQHMGIGGSTGTGKSVLFEHLISQSYDDPNTIGLVLDFNGAFYEKFGRPGDRVLSIFDKRSAHWDFWGEPILPSVVAEALIEEDPGDKFFAPAARGLFSDLLLLNSDIPALRADLSLPFDELAARIRESGGLSETHFKAEEQGAAVLATLTNYLESLKYLNFWNPHGAPFSIVDWVAESLPGWTYIIVRDEEKPLLKPWMRLWMDLAVQGALKRHPKKPHKRFMVFADELPALGELPSLPLLVTNGRKYKTSVVCGWQSEHQIEETYPKKARSVLSCIRSRIYFNPEDEKSAEAAAKHMGKIETFELQDGDSFGLQGNQGESVTQVERDKYLVHPSELTSLDKHNCYFKLPMFDPTKLLILPLNVKPRNAYFESQLPPGVTLRRTL